MAGSRFRLNGERSENEIQHCVADLLDYCLAGEDAFWTHFPAGGYVLSAAASARLYRLGLKRGVPDIVIVYKPNRTLWIELKTPKLGRLSGAQRITHDKLFRAGAPVVTCRSEEEVIAALKRYSVPHREVSFQHGVTPKNARVRTDTHPRPEASEPEELTQGAPGPW